MPPASARARPHRRALLRASVAAVVVVALGACGGDDASDTTGAEVEGRAPATATTTDPETTDGPDAPDPTDAPGTTGEDPPAPGPLAEVAVTLEPVASVDSPTKLVARPGTGQLFVAEQGGRVVLVDPEAGTDQEPEVALDLTDVTTSGGEQGLLGLAFAPDGDTLYVHHSGLDGETRIASFALDGDEVDAGSRTDLLEVDQPYTNHNGGEILVDEEGRLWIGLGDGGSAGDPEDRAQDGDSPLGKVLRLDPDAADGEAEEVVRGVRNPWRMRFDEATGDLWIADVGQNAVEEINRLPAGAIEGTNLGWSRFEGTTVYDDSREVVDGPAVDPVFEMVHDDGWCSVTGGPVYRGGAVPDLDGAYLFGDYCKPGLNAIRVDGDGTVAESVVLDDEVGSVVSIDTDGDGEVYVLSLDGTIARVDPG